MTFKKVLMILKKILALLAILLVIATPYFFCRIFDNGDNSYFLNLHSGISAENWFNFWITYISTIVSAFLALIAFSLSLKIDKIQTRQQMESDKLKFIVKSVESNGPTVGFHIKLSPEVSTLDNVELRSAKLQFDSSNMVVFDIPSEKFHHSFDLCFPRNNVPKDIILWQGYQQYKSEQYRKAILILEFSYNLQSAVGKSKIIIHSYAFLTVDKSDSRLEYNIRDSYIS